MDGRKDVVIEMAEASTHLLSKATKVNYASFQRPLLFRTALQADNCLGAIDSLEDKINTAGSWVREKENYLSNLSKIHHKLYYSAGTSTIVEIIIISMTMLDTNDQDDPSVALLSCASILACMMTVFSQLYGNLNIRNNYTVTYWWYLDKWNEQLPKPVSEMTENSLDLAIRNVNEAFKEADTTFGDSFMFTFLNSLLTTFLQIMVTAYFPVSNPTLRTTLNIAIATATEINSLVTSATLVHGLFKHYQHHPQRQQDNSVLADPSGQINYRSLAKKI